MSRNSGGFLEGMILGFILIGAIKLVLLPFRTKETFIVSLGMFLVIWGGLKISKQNYQIAITRPIYNLTQGQAWDYEPPHYSELR